MRREIKNLTNILQHFAITSYLLLLFAMIAGNIVSAIYSILPSAVIGWGATETNYLGYISHCSFAPWSTLISVALVAVGVYLFVKLIKYFKQNSITSRDILTYFATTSITLVAFTMLFPFTISVIVIYVLYRIYQSHRMQMKDMSSISTEIQN